MKTCNNCKNRGKKRRCDLYTSMSTYAEKCKDFEEKKQTNADRIRSMSDEELAEFWMKSCDNPIAEFNEDICDFCDIYESSRQCDDEYCKKAIVKWLQSEVEV